MLLRPPPCEVWSPGGFFQFSCPGLIRPSGPVTQCWVSLSISAPPHWGYCTYAQSQGLEGISQPVSPSDLGKPCMLSVPQRRSFPALAAIFLRTTGFRPMKQMMSRYRLSVSGAPRDTKWLYWTVFGFQEFVKFSAFFSYSHLWQVLPLLTALVKVNWLVALVPSWKSLSLFGFQFVNLPSNFNSLMGSKIIRMLVTLFSLLRWEHPSSLEICYMKCWQTLICRWNPAHHLFLWIQ